MRILIKLAIAGLVIHGSWRVGSAYWTYYRFRDAVQAAAQFSGDKSEREVQSRVLEIASAMQVPVAPEQVSVRREQNHTFIDAAYFDQIEVLPTYRYPWEFKVKVDAWTVSLSKAGGLAPAPQ